MEDLEEASGDEIAAIRAFQDGMYNDIAVKDFNGSLEEFIAGLENGTISVDGFSEALLAEQVKRKEETVAEKLSGAMQVDGVTAFDSDGVAQNIKLSPAEAQAAMTDIMKKLNESNLSNEDKLQLMDKIN